MSPLQIEILLWYYARAEDYRQGDFSAPAVRSAIDAFNGALAMLIPNEVRPAEDYRTYVLSPRGQAFVDHIMSLPLPAQRWEMPA